MKQILQSYKSGELWLSEVPSPLCKKRGVVIKTMASFVSAGTERMLVDFAKKSLVGKALQMPDQVKKVIRKVQTEGFFETLEKVQTKLDVPIPLGYSAAGIVVEAGTESGFAVGDRVAAGGAGFANHAEYNYVPRNLVVKIPDNVSFEEASTATVGSIALQGVRQCELHLGESVAIIGLGLMGIMALEMCKASGCRVIGFDPNKNRCDLALRLGADVAVCENLPKEAELFSHGRGVDAVLITAATHSNEPVTVAAEICRQKGRVVATGLVGMDIPRDQYYKKEIDFRLSCSYGPGRYDPTYEEMGIDYPFGYVRWTEQRNMEAVLDLISQGKISPKNFITHHFDFDNSLAAYELLLGKVHEPYLGIVLDYAPAETSLPPSRRIDVTSKVFDAQKEIGTSFIGCGNFAKAVLLPQLKKTALASLAGICTASGMSAGETAKKEHFAFATTDATEIFKDTQTKLVIVTTRHDSHANYVKHAIESGKYVFTEKPLCITQSELDEIKQMQNLDRIMVGFNRRFSPHATALRTYFEKRTTPLVMHYRVNAGSIPKNIWIQNPEIGGGRMIGEGCHFADLMSFIANAPITSVNATTITFPSATETQEDSAFVTFTFQDGSIGTLEYVALGDTTLPKERLEIHGSGSTAILDNFCSTHASGSLGKLAITGKQQKGFFEELQATLGSVGNNAPMPIPFSSIENTTRAMFAAIESMRSSKTISL